MAQTTRNNVILVVDDNEQVTAFLKAVLKQSGYEIITASHGNEALENIEETKPDLVLLDVLMPDIDGFEICKKIKSDPEASDLPVIFITAKTETEDIEAGFEAGGDDYITKPFSKGELFSRIDRHLEIYNAKKQIEEKNRELEKLIKFRDKIYSVISHDMQSYMSNIKMLGDAMKAESKSKDEETLEMLDMMEDNINDAFNFLNNLLKWATHENDRLVPDFQYFSPAGAIEDTLLVLKSKKVQKNIDIKLHEKEKLPGKIYGDPHNFKAILRNLLTNAVKFSYKNSIVHIFHRVQDQKLVIRVKDSGIGISPEDQKKLLSDEIHYSSRGTYSEKGAGIGLLISYKMANLNRGDLWFESSEGEGSSFYFSTPLKPEKENGEQSSDGADKHPTQTDLSG